ncbi:MAG: nuclear transport factor 2 family protein [Sphingobium phenoxybenzoativorans]|jgi:ketosteroid isomerase-like protein|uniref:Nuclear transport factor 2 family protein n=1 Tax=Sphingobium phenoxybenzoativorans TaxID=1592790 RepID=A0A975K8I3_9SPHN|nr:nuclear transport factor 2 family protein [Sphingobium phenoxybenzoativorans]QUT06725.1 nuclear transport factor 2 family protein [Sphingobium phenoxybenzoativorans]
MSAEDNKALLRAYFQDVSDGRTADAWDKLAEDALWTVPGHSPLAGTYTKDELAALTERTILARLKDGMTITVKGMVAEGDKVAVEFESRGEREDGKVYAMPYHFLFTVKDGKLWRCVEYLDTHHYVDVILN